LIGDLKESVGFGVAERVVSMTNAKGAEPMSRLKLFAVAILASVVATPVLAQEVISNPGYCAFFYPNANCQNKGPGNPYTDPNWRSWAYGQVPNWTVGVVRKRAPRHRSQY
jgi:hypothetical protein